MTTDLKALEEAIKVESMDPSSEEEGDEFTHAWFEFQEEYGREARTVTLEAARKYLSIQKVRESCDALLLVRNGVDIGGTYGKLAPGTYLFVNKALSPSQNDNPVLFQSAPEFTEEPLDPEFEKVFQENINDLLA